WTVSPRPRMASSVLSSSAPGSEDGERPCQRSSQTQSAPCRCANVAWIEPKLPPIALRNSSGESGFAESSAMAFAHRPYANRVRMSSGVGVMSVSFGRGSAAGKDLVVPLAAVRRIAPRVAALVEGDGLVADRALELAVAGNRSEARRTAGGPDPPRKAAFLAFVAHR